MFRLYNQWTGEHFYTSSVTERDEISKVGWKQEGVGWYAPTSRDLKPVYRLYNSYVEGGDHHYTTSAEEKDACVKAGWTYEGEGWRTVADETESDYVEVLRQYNPFAATGTHNYTTSQSENEHLVSLGWRAEGKGWAGYSKLEPSSSEKVSGNYWLNVAESDTPEKDIIKTKSEIDEDMAVLHGTKTQTSGGKNKDAVSAEYTNYMNGKDAEGNAKEVRLYAKWNCADVTDGTSKNKYVEFRIIQVGEHDGDGSVLTFMATHSLPTIKAMNSTDTNTGGWASSAMRTSVFGENGYVQTGLSGLGNAVKAVNKTTAYRASDSEEWSTSSANSTTSDKFWLVSFSEIFGENDNTITYSGSYKAEGTQYAWCKDKVIDTVTGYYDALYCMSHYRSGGSYGLFAVWSLRSPNVGTTQLFACVSDVGQKSNTRPNHASGVVPCFAFQTNKTN